jgi:hypothetical protein
MVQALRTIPVRSVDAGKLPLDLRRLCHWHRAHRPPLPCWCRDGIDGDVQSSSTFSTPVRCATRTTTGQDQPDPGPVCDFLGQLLRRRGMENSANAPVSCRLASIEFERTHCRKDKRPQHPGAMHVKIKHVDLRHFPDA